jgi:hypothetical protein
MRPLLFVLAMLPLLALETGQPLPPLKGEFLTGRDATLPAAAQGKPALLLLGFTYKSRFAVEDYAKRFRADFPNEPRVAFFEIPMISGMAKMGKWFIDSGMRRGTPKADHERVITVYSGAGEWKKHVNYQAPDDAYLIVIDGAGRVAWQHHGPFDAAKAGEIAAKMRELVR